MKKAYKEPIADVLSTGLDDFAGLPANLFEPLSFEKEKIKPTIITQSGENSQFSAQSPSSIHFHGKGKQEVHNGMESNIVEYFLKNIESLNNTINRLIDIIEKKL